MILISGVSGCAIVSVPIGLYGFQHYLSMLGSLILIPLVIVPAMGGTYVSDATILEFIYLFICFCIVYMHVYVRICVYLYISIVLYGFTFNIYYGRFSDMI